MNGSRLRWLAIAAASTALGVLVVVGARAWLSEGAGTAGPVRQIMTHGDSVPDLAEHFTVASVKDGAWSDAATWDTGRVPAAGDTVRIVERTTVVYDVQSDRRLRGVGVAGALRFQTTSDTRLRLTHLLVYQGGTLTIGDEAQPIQPSVVAEVVINDEPLETGTDLRPGNDPGQFGNGVLVWGTLSLRGSERTPAFSRLEEEAASGDSALLLAETPRGWRAGDRVLLPDSRQIGDAEIEQANRSPYNLEGSRGIVARPEWEVAAITAIDGARVTLETPLRFEHRGVRDASGSLARGPAGTPLIPHVANLSRNVIFRSEKPDGIRGHLICFRGASVGVANALFSGLGRTGVDVIDNTSRDDQGRVLHIGTNQLGRYPIHMHHLVDAMRVGPAEQAFQITGSVVEHARRWGIAIHGSHYGLVSDNVVVDVDGAGIVTEDGSETGNRFEHNFVAAVRGSGQTVDARRSRDGLGHEGAGFWFGSDNNTVVNNVAAGVRDGGFTLFRAPEALAFPAFPARTPSAQDGGPVRVFEFTGNEVYGAADTGIELWDSKDCAPCRSGDAVLRETTVWHSRSGITYDYHADFYRFDGLSVRGDPGRTGGTYGVRANSSRQVSIARTDIQNVDVGIDGGGDRNRVTRLDRVTIRARVGIRIRRGNSWDSTGVATFRNVAVTPISGPDGKLVELDGSPYGKGSVKVALRRPVYFTDFQNQRGANFQLFFSDQAPGVLVPQDADRVRGCPEPGLTNAECFQKHGIAIGGEPATCNVTLDGVDGFTCPVPPGTSINH